MTRSTSNERQQLRIEEHISYRSWGLHTSKTLRRMEWPLRTQKSKTNSIQSSSRPGPNYLTFTISLILFACTTGASTALLDTLLGGRAKLLSPSQQLFHWVPDLSDQLLAICGLKDGVNHFIPMDIVR